MILSDVLHILFQYLQSLLCKIPCLTRSALVLRLVSANPLKTLICRHICGVTDHVSEAWSIVLVFLCVSWATVIVHLFVPCCPAVMLRCKCRCSVNK